MHCRAPAAQSQFHIILINPTNNFVAFKSGTLIEILVETHIVYSESNPDEKAPYIEGDVSMRVLTSSNAVSDKDVHTSLPVFTTSDNAPLPSNPILPERLLNNKDLTQIHGNMPKHLHSLFESSFVNLYNEPAVACGQTPIEFEGVIAKDDIDIG